MGIKKFLKVFLIIILVVVGGIIFRYFGAFNNFLDKITNRGPELKNYSVLVLKNSGMNKIEDVERENVGFLKNDPNVVATEKFLQNKIKLTPSYYDEVDTLISVLENKITAAIVFESDRVQAILEMDENPLKNTQIIYTFDIEINKEETKVSEKEVTKEPFVLYISGSDSRSGIKATARSDVNILAVVNPAKAKILLVSIPRDTYVQLHDTTGLKDKLTHAGIYGINMSKTTIEDFLGIKIDHTLKVSFETVVKVVDQIDGIEIESDTEMSLKVEGKDKKCNFTVGKQMVDGDCALRFARERKSYASGDRHRGENQQQVITAIIAKLSNSTNYLLKIPTILDIAADSFETSMTRDDISDFIRMQLGKNPRWETESITVDGQSSMQPTYSMGANLPLYVMVPNHGAIMVAQDKIAEYLRPLVEE